MAPVFDLPQDPISQRVSEKESFLQICHQFIRKPRVQESGVFVLRPPPQAVPPEMIKDFLDAEIGVVQSVTWENNKANETLESSEEIRIEKPGKRLL